MPEVTYSADAVEEQDTVATASLAYKEMAWRWPKLHALLGGTPVMRQAREQYLPAGKKEDPELYRVKLEMAYLYNAYRNTVSRVVGKPFSRQVDIREKEALPERLQLLEDDVDLTGQDLTQFLRNVMAAGVIYGLSHVLVDFDNTSPNLNSFEERSAGTRARFIHVLPTQLIGWWPDTGRPKEIRIREFRREREPGKEYLEEINEYIRVYREDSWEVHKKIETRTEGVMWELVDAGLHSFGRVPIATYYVKRTGNMTAEPPFDDLAWVNIAHWQSNADQRNILRFARVPILGLFGFKGKDLAGGIAIGSAGITNDNTSARIEWAEHSGKAIEAGANDLLTLRDEMEALGDQPLRERSGDITATGRAIDEARVHCDIHAWVRSLEATALEMYRMAGQWTKDELPEGFAVNVYDEFNLLMRSEQDMAVLDRARVRGDITRLTWLREAKSRSVLSTDVNPEEEDDALENAAPSLPFFPGESDDDDDDDTEE